MTVFRTDKTQGNYQKIDNRPLNDPNLSFEARGVLGYLLTKPDHWKINRLDLQREGGIGKRKAVKLLKELEDAGYLYRERYMSINKFSWQHNLYESPEINPNYISPNSHVTVLNLSETVTCATTSTEPETEIHMSPFCTDSKGGHIVITDHSNDLKTQSAKSNANSEIQKRRSTISDYFREENIPVPQEEELWTKVEHPAVVHWLMITSKWPGYSNLDYIIEQLSNPNLDALAQSWKLWIASGYSPNNLVGVFEWYRHIVTDNTWTPTRLRRNQNGKSRTHSKADAKQNAGTSTSDEQWFRENFVNIPTS